VGEIAEIWCHAPPELIGVRYRARLGQRHAGHLGESYVPELIELAGRTQPLGSYPLLEVDTTKPLDLTALGAWLDKTFRA
jgi:glucokinase